MREFWVEVAPQGPGAQPFDTGIAISAGQLSRVQGFLSVTNVAGLPIMTAAASVVNGHLRITVTNGGAPGSTATWTLDIALLSSTDQGKRAGAGFITISNATAGLVGPQTLTQTYAVGAASADQTMVITQADGGAIIVDAEASAAGANPSVAFEVRQNGVDAGPWPLLCSRRGNFANPAAIYFEKARGTFAAPADVVQNDMLGCIDFFGRIGGVMSAQPGAQIIALVTSVAGGAIDGQLEFWTALDGATTKCITTGMIAANTPVTVFFESGHLVLPNVNQQGHLGAIGSVRHWAEVAAYDVNVMANVQMGGVAVGGGAVQTVLLPVAGTTIPAPQAGHVYLGGATFTGDTGQGDASLGVSSEELAIAIGQVAATHLIPIMFNGHAYYLLAADDEQA